VTDGVDLAPLLLNPEARLDRQALYFHYPHYYPTTTPVGAIRAGDWKLLEYFEDNRLELYDLSSDPSESINQISQQPRKAAELLQQLREWREAVDASLPTPNPKAKQESRKPVNP
ncbi:MAG: sulfatase/phosphatase domain-containing protein, partial [Planctomycetaceae bacterium]